MPKTVDTLYNLFHTKNGKLTAGVLVDYFGVDIINDENNDLSEKRINTLMGIYKGLFIMGVSTKEIEKHFKSNSLDALIDEKYSQNISKYYQEYKQNNIKIGPTYYLSF
jgi:L-arabinose isomerase